MSLIKIMPNAKIGLFGKTLFSTSGGGGSPVSPVDTAIYDSSGNVLYTVNGDIPDMWKSSQNISGYVEIGTSATSIGSDAFSYNSITSVIIPSSVTSIGNRAFAFNYSLDTVNCYAAQTAFVGSNAFAYGLSPVTIHVKATDGTWTAGTTSFQGISGATVIKDL